MKTVEFLGGLYGMGSALGWGPWGGGINWRSRPTGIKTLRARRKVRNRIASKSRARNRT